ncbi:MAG TPA: chromosomal replication initiator DnaA [Brevundimonas sp.]|uniref:chromosomal replication initiator DnaA n=1 Tax=Brevundimonas sp. TaxID=1871086 RepID=UPI002DE99A4D|nr:chromosomal replication initiator DnaA [Brevundimonas sp.]
MRLDLAHESAGVDRPFVTSACNAAAVERLASWPDALTPVLALVGPKGSGKSRLAADWAERVGAVPVHGAEASLLDPLEVEGRAILLDRAPDADDETLFHLINLARSGGGALLLVARSAPSSWETALPDLRSRLDAVPTVTIETPDDAVLAEMLEAEFARRSIAPPPDLIPWLLKRIERSSGAAEAAVARLDAEPGAVTRAAARRIFGPLGPGDRD